MRRIDHFNLRNFDLNLLLAFDALMQEQSVTLAAERLRIQQPAMSHSLSTLRLLLQDPLFVRTGTRMEPTPRAVALGGLVRRILQDAQDALLSRDSFDPAEWSGSFRVGINVQMEALILPGLLRTLRGQAPRLCVVASPVARQKVFGQLDDGSIDLAIGYLPGGLSWHARERLFEEAHVCCFSRQMLGAPAPVSLADYARLPHGLVSAENDTLGCLEDAFERAGIQPNVAVASPNVMTLAMAALEAPLVITVAERFARRYAPAWQLEISPLPIDFPTLTVDMLWHARAQDDLAHGWFRRCVAEVARAVAAEGE